MPAITPFLWFDTEAEEAAGFYVSVFPNSSILSTSRYAEGTGPGAPGDVLTVAFELDGRRFTALNGGPQFKFTEALSLVIECADQAEVDRYWEALTAGGGEHSVCGWLKDRYGLSWQVVPRILFELIDDSDQPRAERVMQAVMQMAKLDIAGLEQAAAG
jgi:predicted 3-demethylubiquinone-9 3-methyltransferase (glyoxalase superfamily)